MNLNKLYEIRGMFHALCFVEEDNGTHACLERISEMIDELIDDYEK